MTKDALNNPNVALGGFWDPQPTPPPKPLESHKVVEAPKMMIKKPVINLPVLNPPVKKETSPAAEFEIWCTTVLAPWSSKIDGTVKTFRLPITSKSTEFSLSVQRWFEFSYSLFRFSYLIILTYPKYPLCNSSK